MLIIIRTNTSNHGPRNARFVADWMKGQTRYTKSSAGKIINLWILHDPMGDGGRDRLAMQVVLRFHKSHNKEITPPGSPSSRRRGPVLCPPSHLLAKALAEGSLTWLVMTPKAGPSFNTRIGMPTVYIS
jgi:hypothetical protein